MKPEKNNDNKPVRLLLSAIDMSDVFNPKTYTRLYELPFAYRSKPVEYLRGIAEFYLKTKEGAKEARENSDTFNWGDFFSSIPEYVLQKYGVKEIQDDIIEETVDHDENLYSETI